MSDNTDVSIKDLFVKLVRHLCDEGIIVFEDIKTLDDRGLYDSVVLLKEVFKEQYPTTRIKPIMKSVHYANRFENEELKNSAYLLDDIEQYLTFNKFLDHDESVEFFNNKITSKDFVVSPNSLLSVMLLSLLECRK